eukprot:757120-Hanusia_phi.AAC.1
MGEGRRGEGRRGEVKRGGKGNSWQIFSSWMRRTMEWDGDRLNQMKKTLIFLFLCLQFLSMKFRVRDTSNTS